MDVIENKVVVKEYFCQHTHSKKKKLFLEKVKQYPLEKEEMVFLKDKDSRAILSPLLSFVEGQKSISK